MAAQMPNSNRQQMKAYREMSLDDLFETQWVRVKIGPEDLPGFKGPRVVCGECGEGVSFAREVEREGRVLCRSCAGGRYYEPIPS